MLHQIVNTIGGVGYGLLKAKEYSSDLEIETKAEKVRYYKKVFNLSLMYAGFSDKIDTRQIKGIGNSAFLSCLYDVCTDWGKDSKKFMQIADRVLRAESGDYLGNMAISMMKRDENEQLNDDGLERGSTTVHFITQLMGVEEYIENISNGDLDELGYMLQIIDDVLDLEDDDITGDTNCINSDNRLQYLNELISYFSRNIFPENTLITFLINKVIIKAKKLRNKYHNMQYQKDINYETGNEVKDRTGKIDIEKSIDKTVELLIARNPKKYKDFWSSIEKTDFLAKIMKVPDREERVQILKYIYIAFRVLDDICDGDTPNNMEEADIKQIIYNASVGDESTYGLYNLLMKVAFSIAEELGIVDEVHYFTQKIAKSLMFDAERRFDQNPNRTQRGIKQRSFDVDIDGTEYGSAIILGINPQITIDRLSALGIATRKAYDINDIFDDIYARIINISIEDIKSIGITEDDFLRMKQLSISKTKGDYISYEDMPLSIQLWIQKEIGEIKMLLTEYHAGYSVWGILNDNQTIPASYNQSKVRRIYNNLILKLLALKKGYLSEINGILALNQ